MQLIILDRDGVINQDSDAYIKSLAEWQPIPGSIEAIAQLSQAGWTVAVATNQSGLARGYYNQTTLSNIHRHLQALVSAQGGRLGIIRYCPHGPDEGCGCRKPKPGLLLEIATHYQRSLSGVWFVGDALGDLQAALAVGCQPVLVRTGKGVRTLTKDIPESTLVFADLAAVADHLLA